MKKLLLSLVLLLTMALVACSSESNVKVQGDEKTNTQEKVESEYPFPSSELMGDATITISTPGGDSSDGNVPVLFVSSDTLLEQIGINYENFDGNVETYVYINEIFSEKVQAGELMQSTLELTEDNLKGGEYTITAVQFTDNDPSKDPFNVAEAKFKIEESK